ncbi:MAG: hypothetical protein ACKVX9_03345 [Blastocatellia bacterium]
MKKLFGDAVAAAFSAIPCRRRFPIALRLAHWLHPLARLAERMGARRLPLNGPRERMLMFFLHRLLEREVDFEPAVEVRPARLLEESGGVLILACHMWMNSIWLRWLSMGERKVSLVSVLPSLHPLFGRHHRIEKIPTDANTYLRIRQRVRDGRIVYLTLDLRSPRDSFRRVEIDGESLYFSANTFHFARRAAIPILFAFARVSDQGRVVVHLMRPSSIEAGAAFDEYCRFISTEAAQLRA